jgi:hypothetical protein
MSTMSYRPARWLTPPPATRVEDLRCGPLHGEDAARRQRRHAGQALQEVQRGALGGEQGARVAGRAQHRRGRLAPLALRPEPLEPHVGVQREERRLGGGEAEDDAGRLLRDRRDRARAERHRRLARDVGVPDVLGERLQHELIERR